MLYRRYLVNYIDRCYVITCDISFNVRSKLKCLCKYQLFCVVHQYSCTVVLAASEPMKTRRELHCRRVVLLGCSAVAAIIRWMCSPLPRRVFQLLECLAMHSYPLLSAALMSAYFRCLAAYRQTVGSPNPAEFILHLSSSYTCTCDLPCIAFGAYLTPW